MEISYSQCYWSDLCYPTKSKNIHEKAQIFFDFEKWSCVLAMDLASRLAALSWVLTFHFSALVTSMVAAGGAVRNLLMDWFWSYALISAAHLAQLQLCDSVCGHDLLRQMKSFLEFFLVKTSSYMPVPVVLLVASRYALPGYGDRRVWVRGPGWLHHCVRL